MNIEVELSYRRLECNDLKEEVRRWRTLALFGVIVIAALVGLEIGGVL